MIRRRDFITLLGGTAAAWPLAAWPLASAHAQRERMQRNGVLIAISENDFHP